MMTIYYVECTSKHKLYYAVRTNKQESELADIVKEKLADGTLENFAQKWQGEKVDKIVEMTEEEFTKKFDNLNKAQKGWTEKDKLLEARNIDRPQPEMLNDEDLL